MRKKIVAGNWKMNKTLNEATSLISEIISLLPTKINADIIIAPPFLFIQKAVDLTKRSAVIKIAAQNCSEHDKGAFTGEVSAEMISSMGAKAVIIGHSERRQYFKETSVQLFSKVQLALKNNLTPIFCIGEMLEERNANRHFEVIKTQLADTVFKLSKEDFAQLVIAYEPVWAIGTGVTATSDQAQEIHAHIRTLISENYTTEVADACRILYGGSCNAKNARELFNCPDVDGGLIGGASLIADDFIKIIKAT
jgi:triosephosphate isomerase